MSHVVNSRLLNSLLFFPFNFVFYFLLVGIQLLSIDGVSQRINVINHEFFFLFSVKRSCFEIKSEFIIWAVVYVFGTVDLLSCFGFFIVHHLLHVHFHNFLYLHESRVALDVFSDGYHIRNDKLVLIVGFDQVDTIVHSLDKLQDGLELMFEVGFLHQVKLVGTLHAIFN